MTRNASRCLMLFAGLFLAGELSAQAVMPSYLSTYCNTLKPGSYGDMMRNESAWARALERSSRTPNMLGMLSVSGAPTACYMFTFTSMAEFAAFQEANETVNPRFDPASKAYALDARSYIAALRRDLSTGAPNVLSTRVVGWNVYHMRPGSEGQFAAGVKALAAARTRAGLKNEFRIYQVMNGAPGDTYWAMGANEDFAALDRNLAGDAKMMTAVTPDDLKVFNAFWDRLVSTSSDVWMVNSPISAIKPALRAQHPFWKLPATTAGK